MEFSRGANLTEQCWISPPSNSVSRTSLPLTILDVAWLPVPPVQRLFFYEHHTSKDHFTNTILPNIKYSLSLALQQFFPLAGNLTWPRDSSIPKIHYVDGDSVSLTVAESDYDFHVLVCSDANDVGAYYSLVPQLINTPAEKGFPLISFIVTFFPDKGFSIGITYNHAVADGRAVLHFIKTWASICQGIQGTSSSTMNDNSLLPQPPTICRSLDTEKPNNSTGSEVSIYLKKANITRDTFCTPNHLYVATDKVLATVVMGRADINRLKQWVLANKKENAPPLHLSTFVLTCAYVWVCSIKARSGESVAVASEEDETEYFAFVVDCRRRLDPPLPITHFGNCLMPALVRAKTSDLTAEHGIPLAAELIGNAIRKIESGNSILNEMETILSCFLTSPSRVLSVAGSTKFGIYDTDFGWGKPKKTQVISIATSGAISLSDCPSELGAVEVGLVREKQEMAVFLSLYRNTLDGFPECY